MNRPAAADRIFWLLCVLVFFQAPSLYAGEKPLIAIEFKIEAQDFRDNLAKVLDNTQRDISLDLAGLFQKRFSFYEWHSWMKIKDRSLASAVLTISLRDGDSGPIGRNVFLNFVADIRDKGAAFDCERGRRKPSRPQYDKLQHELYSASVLQPTGKAALLRKDININLGSLIADGSPFRNDLAESFFRDVPFCREAEPAANLIAINLSEDELKADIGSTMNLILCSRPPEEILTRGNIDLTVTDERLTEGKWVNMTQVSPGAPKFGGLKKPYRIPELFAYGAKGSLGLFMADFHKRAENTSGPYVSKGTP